jgi:PhnB protein
MSNKVKPIPEGYNSITPYLAIKGAVQAIAFYKEVFGAKERICMDANGKVAHAELQIGDSMIMLADEFPEMEFFAPKDGRPPVSIHLYVENVDTTFEKAVKAGAKVIQPLANQFYGDRSGMIEDPYGHVWNISSHVEDVAPEEMERRQKEFMQQKQTSCS